MAHQQVGADGELIRETRAPALYEKLPPGTYDVEARLGLASARQTVEVAADAPTPLRINLDAGVLKLLARAAKGRPAAADTDIHGDRTRRRLGPGLGCRYGWGARRSPRSCCRLATTGSAQNGIARQRAEVKIAAATGTTFDAVLAIGQARALRGARQRPRTRASP